MGKERFWGKIHTWNFKRLKFNSSFWEDGYCRQLCLCWSITGLTISLYKRHSPTYQVEIFAKMVFSLGIQDMKNVEFSTWGFSTMIRVFGVLRKFQIISNNAKKNIWLAARYRNSHLAQTSLIGHVNIIPSMQFFTGVSRNTQSKSYTLSLTECLWEFQNIALWDAD